MPTTKSLLRIAQEVERAVGIGQLTDAQNAAFALALVDKDGNVFRLVDGKLPTDIFLNTASSAQAAIGAATYAAPSAALGAATYAAPDAVPADSTELTAPTTAEFNGSLDAIASVRTQLIALAADVDAHKTLVNSLRTQLVALAADVAAHKTLINALRTADIAQGVIKGSA